MLRACLTVLLGLLLLLQAPDGTNSFRGEEGMKEEEVIRAATEYAEREGWRVDDYEVSSAAKEGARYRVRFEGKSGRVGDHFSVVVDASTGQATQLIPGR